MARLGDSEGRASGEKLERLSCFEEDEKPNSVSLTDLEILDCPICYEPLTAPVFQCENGHVTCSICCPKLKNKCSFCRSVIGFIRNRAIEKALESAKLLCPNSKYGCEETLTYNKIHHHKCRYEPCLCPLSGCNYAAPSGQLYKHFSDQHKSSGAIPFRFNIKISNAALHANEDYSIILREEKHGFLFILKKTVYNQDWNKISVFRIGSPSDEKGSFKYNIEVSDACGWTVPFPSLPMSSRNKDYDKAEAEADPFTVYFEVSDKTLLTLDLCIHPIHQLSRGVTE